MTWHLCSQCSQNVMALVQTCILPICSVFSQSCNAFIVVAFVLAGAVKTELGSKKEGKSGKV